MNGQDFQSLMQSAFEPFLAPLGFAMQPVHVSGKSYRGSFVSRQHTLLVSFEPGEAHTAVMLLTNGDEDLRSIDDPERSPRLANLNARYMHLVTASERAENENFFAGLKPSDATERALIKSAKELRLVLPRHLAAGS